MAKIPARQCRTQPKVRSITKAQGYACGVFTAETDLEALIMAFGVKAVAECVEKIYHEIKTGSNYRNRDKHYRKLKDRVDGVARLDPDAEIAA